MTSIEYEKLVQMITQAVLRALTDNSDTHQVKAATSAPGESETKTATTKYVLPCGHEFRTQENSIGSATRISTPVGNSHKDIAKILTKRLVSEADILSALRQNQRKVVISSKTILTPLALDCCKQNGVTISYHDEISQPISAGVGNQAAKKVLILAPASNHTQITAVSEAVTAAGLEPELWPARIPSFHIQAALAELGERIVAGLSACGIVIHENVFPLCTQANRMAGIHGVVGWDLSSVQMSQANLLFLNPRQFGLNMLQKLVQAWLTRSSRPD